MMRPILHYDSKNERQTPAKLSRRTTNSARLLYVRPQSRLTWHSAGGSFCIPLPRRVDSQSASFDGAARSLPAITVEPAVRLGASTLVSELSTFLRVWQTTVCYFCACPRRTGLRGQERILPSGEKATDLTFRLWAFHVLLGFPVRRFHNSIMFLPP